MKKQKSRFRAVTVAAFAAWLMLGRPAMAQEQSGKAIPNTVWVGADGKFESDPDTALVQFGISAQEEKLQDATQKATQAAEQVRQLLRSNAIDPGQAQIGRFATEPVYDYKNPKRKLVGYRVEANISIKLKDFSKIGPITEGLSTLDVTNTSISYQLDSMDAAKIRAVEDALRRARDEASAVAQSSGRTLGELSYASVDTYEPQPIRPMMARAAPGAMEAGAPPPTAGFSAEKITVTAHVNALYNLK
ncbi:MAG TPA: SIMPL domain-containing protein [Candidatus Binatia bacterium]|nr:SIMPL domain-containing protein [Candidatus Binatia bacterium]